MIKKKTKSQCNNELYQNSEVMYADKEKTASLLHTAGFPNAYRIEQSDYVGSISYKNDEVKLSGKIDEVFVGGR